MVVSAIALVIACSPRPRTPSSPADWSLPPAVATDPPFVAPTFHELRLSIGIRVLFVEDHRLPLVAVTTVHSGAGSRADGERQGLAALTSDALASDSELAFPIERAGARLETAVTTDYAAVRLVALSDHIAPAIELLAGAIRRPRFDDGVLARLREQRVAELALQAQRPRAIAARVFDRVAFGDAHPYAHTAQGSAAAVAGVTRDNVSAFWARTYSPVSTTIVAAGDITPTELARTLDAAFAGWAAPATTTAPALPATAAPPAPIVAVVDVPGAPQTSVLIGRRGPAGDPVATELVNALLGGSPGAALDRRLRDELGVASAASSNFWRGEWDQTWAVAATMRADATVAGVRAALELIEAARRREPGAAELARARTLVLRGAAPAFDTARGTARALERLVGTGLPTDYFATLPTRVAAVTPAAARTAFELASQQLSIVIVGDAAVIGDLRGFGLPVVRYAADGRRE
jgi:zinc protease